MPTLARNFQNPSPFPEQELRASFARDPTPKSEVLGGYVRSFEFLYQKVMTLHEDALLEAHERVSRLEQRPQDDAFWACRCLAHLCHSLLRLCKNIPADFAQRVEDFRRDPESHSEQLLLNLVLFHEDEEVTKVEQDMCRTTGQLGSTTSEPWVHNLRINYLEGVRETCKAFHDRDYLQVGLRTAWMNYLGGQGVVRFLRQLEEEMEEET
jgi:hypothetical protein